MKHNIFLTILFIFLISIISIAQDTGKKHLRNRESRVIDNKENSLQISVPRTLNYQGFLTDSDGTNLNNTYQIRFRIFTLLVSGDACYDQLYSVSINEGHFNQVLENVVDCNFEQTTWLQIDVDGEELSPRQEITSAASSLTSDQVDGFDANSTATAGTLYPLGSDANFSLDVIPEVPTPSHATTHNEGEIDVISVTSSVIVDGTIVGADIANSTIPLVKLDFTPVTRPLSPGVSTTEIANNAVTSSKILDLTITSADIANSTIPIGKLNFTPLTTASDYGRSGVATNLYEGSLRLNEKYMSLSGNGMINAANVSSGEFGSNTGGGAFSFPFSLSGKGQVVAGDPQFSPVETFYSDGEGRFGGGSSTLYIGTGSQYGDLYVTNTSGSNRVHLSGGGASNIGIVKTWGSSGNTATRISTNTVSSNYGAMEYFNNGSPRVFIGVGSAGQGILQVTNSSGALTYTINGDSPPAMAVGEDPRDPSNAIYYSTLAGPEASVYLRGTARLLNGRVIITLPEHFGIAAANYGLTVQLTSLSGDSKGLAVTSKSNIEITVEELGNGNGNYQFDYLVHAVRKGEEDYKVFRSKDAENVLSFPVSSTIKK